MLNSPATATHANAPNSCARYWVTEEDFYGVRIRISMKNILIDQHFVFSLISCRLSIYWATSVTEWRGYKLVPSDKHLLRIFPIIPPMDLFASLCVCSWGSWRRICIASPRYQRRSASVVINAVTVHHCLDFSPPYKHLNKRAGLKSRRFFSLFCSPATHASQTKLQGCESGEEKPRSCSVQPYHSSTRA